MNSSSADNTSLSLLQRARGDDQAAWQTMVAVYGPIIEQSRLGTQHYRIERAAVPPLPPLPPYSVPVAPVHDSGH